MLVVDASAFVDFLASPEESAVQRRLEADGHWVVPEHFTIEVTNALRGLWLRRKIMESQLDKCLAGLARGAFDVWPTRPLLPRIRELMHNATAYDAAYVALAEELNSTLLTKDGRLTRVPGARCAFIDS